MKLKALLTTEEFGKLKPEHQEFYNKQEDGTYVLDGVDDKDFKSKVDDFRSNNRKLMGEKDELAKQLEKYKNIDPARYDELVKIQADMDKNEDLQLIKAGKLDEVVQRRLKAMVESHDKERGALKSAVEDVTGKYTNAVGTIKRLALNSGIAGSVSKIGVLRKGALEDVINRASGVWSADEAGKLTAKDLFNAKGDPMTMDEWASQLLQTAPHFFEPGGGGGAGGNKGENRTNDGNKTTLRNPTPADIGRKGTLEAVATGKTEVVYD